MRQSIRIESCKGHSHILTWDDENVTDAHIDELPYVFTKYICGKILHKGEAVWLLGKMVEAQFLAKCREAAK